MAWTDDVLESAGIEAVQGIEEVGYDYEEIGRAAVAKAKARMRTAMPANVTGRLPSPDFGRSARETLRRAPLGFPQFSLGAAIGATNTQSSKAQREFHPDRLLIIPSGAGIVIDSVKVGDDEQLLANGVPVELYGTNALTDTLPDNFSPVPSGIDLSMQLRNTTAGALTALAGMKGSVKR